MARVFLLFFHMLLELSSYEWHFIPDQEASTPPAAAPRYPLAKTMVTPIKRPSMP